MLLDPKRARLDYPRCLCSLVIIIDSPSAGAWVDQHRAALLPAAAAAAAAAPGCGPFPYTFAFPDAVGPDSFAGQRGAARRRSLSPASRPDPAAAAAARRRRSRHRSSTSPPPNAPLAAADDDDNDDGDDSDGDGKGGLGCTKGGAMAAARRLREAARVTAVMASCRYQVSAPESSLASSPLSEFPDILNPRILQSLSLHSVLLPRLQCLISFSLGVTHSEPSVFPLTT